jgi:hypothetical protein
MAMNKTYFVSTALKRLFLMSAFCTVAWMIVMSVAIKPLNSKQIVAFELAKTTEIATRIIDGWEQADVISNARRSIYLDFVFLFLYSAAICLGCIVLSVFTENITLISLGKFLSAIVPLAGVFDVIENFAMLNTLSGVVTALPVAIAFWFAMCKFSILVFSLVFLLICLAVWGLKLRLRKGNL